MWTYNYSTNDELMHYGVLGMKWGKRKARASSGNRQERKQAKDFKKMEKITRKAMVSIKKLVDYQQAHTYRVNGSDNQIVITDNILKNKAIKGEQKIDKILEKMNKKYGKASAIPINEDGKAYLDIMLGENKKRLSYDDLKSTS